MEKDRARSPQQERKLKIIFCWYIYAIYTLLIFNVYLAVYNFFVHRPMDHPLISVAHSLFIGFLLYQLLQKRPGFGWVTLFYFLAMRLYYANVRQVEFTWISLVVVFVLLLPLLAGIIAIGQLADPNKQPNWLTPLKLRQWLTLGGMAAGLTFLSTYNYFSGE